MVSGGQTECWCLGHNSISYWGLVIFFENKSIFICALLGWELKDWVVGRVGRGGASGGVSVGMMGVWVGFITSTEGVLVRIYRLWVGC